ncbi:serine/threonine protein kinase [Psychrobacter sp. SZ93C1]|uniref:serine/threonine protein kinase n=1 Tax=Psychrobacter sp. SZ93C1 TaxID=2792058 RepID=UPI0018CD5FA3|nr:protein kinase [Psychrobacter sp. SZ93C1]MBH0064925.1 protein kinase [Psychrobacter sp. SZ93C1]
MKNNASNLSIKQALQVQAQQILPIITQELVAQHFSEIVHQRIAQQSTEQTQDEHAQVVKTQDIKTQNIENTYYQGLTRAQHPQFGQVMIKWQLSADAYPISPDLTHEADVLAAVNASLKIKNKAIAPPLLAHHCVSVQILEQPHKLIVVVMPHYSNGSLAGQLSDRNQHSLTMQQKHYFLVQSAHLIVNLHEASWLHNDIKPSNILLDYFFDDALLDSADTSSLMPNLLLTDFALAERFNDLKEGSPAGTPAYLAPERWQGQSATVQSDIYAFGVMMVEILTGTRPFQVSANSNDKLKAWAIQHCQQPIPKLLLEYSHYQCIVDKALAKRVERRYQDLDKVLIDLRLLGNS